ncbi:MAG TPA: hypothetical protein VIH88_15505 [Candidatus Acidoferrales bacterium]
MQPRQAIYITNVRARPNDRANIRLPRAQNLQRAVEFIARIHHDPFTRLRIAQNRATALQHPHRNNFDYQFFPHIESTATFPAVSQVPIAAAVANSPVIRPVLDTYLKVERILA